MILALLLACGPTALTVGTPTGTDDTSASSDDTGDDPVEPYFASGDYSGTLGWYMPDYGWDICAERMDFSIDDEGNLSAEGMCEYEGQSGDQYDLPIELSGAFDEDGALQDGEISFDTFEYTNTWEVNTLTTEVTGSVDDDGDLELAFETRAEMGNDGNLDVIGYAEAELD